MLTGIKRTKNNDLVINQQGLSVLNILFITSALTVLFFFIPLVKGYDESYSMFSILTAGVDELGYTTVWIKGYVMLLLVYPIANIVLWVLNKKATGKLSYTFVHIIYMITLSFGFMHFIFVNLFTKLGGGMITAWILWPILVFNLVLAVFGILKTGFAQVDENAMAADLNVDYAKGILNKAGSMATTVAENVSAAAGKAMNPVTCDRCGTVCSESSTFCTKCGNNLENAKRMRAASNATNTHTVRCDKCGSECSDTSAFCTKCGNSLENAKRAKAMAATGATAAQNSSTVDEAAKIAREMASNTNQAEVDTKVSLEKPQSEENNGTN